MKKYDLKKLKYNTFFYFVLFAVIILVTVWVFQVLFLESHYRKVKNDALIISSERITQSIESENPDDFLSSVTQAVESGIKVYIVNYAVDDEGKPEIKVDYSSTEGYPVLSESVIVNPQTERILIDVIFACGNGESSGSTQDGNMLYNVSKIDDSSYLTLFYSVDTIKETIKIIQAQLLLVLGVIIVIAFALALYISNKLSKPIVEMSKTAKRWANGEQDVNFTNSGGYTEIVELGQALNYAKEETSKSGQLQRDLLANVSHDLKTPLTMIKAYAEMITDLYGDNKAKRDESTKVIIDETDRLTNLVNDILDLSKLQSSTDEINLTQVNISELTELVIYRFENFMKVSGYKIESDIQPDLFTLVDENKISQVIYNLLGNSLNYTGEDKTVKVYLYKSEDKILLEIIDSGKGIDNENINTIWEKYYRFSETHKRPVKGTGLGLSIVKTILDAHGLKYGVISKKDVGSNFFVEFKVLQDE